MSHSPILCCKCNHGPVNPLITNCQHLYCNVCFRAMERALHDKGIWQIFCEAPNCKQFIFCWTHKLTEGKNLPRILRGTEADIAHVRARKDDFMAYMAVRFRDKKAFPASTKPQIKPAVPSAPNGDVSAKEEFDEWEMVDANEGSELTDGWVNVQLPHLASRRSKAEAGKKAGKQSA